MNALLPWSLLHATEWLLGHNRQVCRSPQQQ